ncbi:MAG: hypothetical protein V1772_02610 [Chloroflexota bacterium]
MPLSRFDKPGRLVPAQIIQRIFNDGQYAEKIRAGELVERRKRSRHCPKPPTGHPSCTCSEMVYYCTPDGETVALVHLYRKPDGTIGGSGRPDPKMLVLEDEILWVSGAKEVSP